MVNISNTHCCPELQESQFIRPLVFMLSLAYKLTAAGDTLPPSVWRMDPTGPNRT